MTYPAVYFYFLSQYHGKVDKKQSSYYIRKQMKEEASEFSRLLKDIKRTLKFRSGKPSTEGEELITLYIKDEGDIFIPFSSAKCGEDDIINPGIIEYLEARVHHIPLKKKITIEIEYGGTIPDDPLLPQKLIKQNFEKSINASLRRNSRLFRDAIVFALLGIGLLGLVDRIPAINDFFAFNNLFTIMSWVFIWRFTEVFFFDRARLKFRMKKLFQINMAEYRVKS